MLIYAIACTFALGMLVGVQVTFFGAYLKDKREEAAKNINESEEFTFYKDEHPINLINPDSVR